MTVRNNTTRRIAIPRKQNVRYKICKYVGMSVIGFGFNILS